MLQRHFILIFTNASFLAILLIGHHGFGPVQMLWLAGLTPDPMPQAVIGCSLFAAIIILSFLSARGLFTKPLNAYLLSILLLAGFINALLMQMEHGREYLLIHLISASPTLGCCIYLVVKPSKILRSNNTPLIPKQED